MSSAVALSKQIKQRIKSALFIGAGVLTLIIITLGIWLYRLDSEITVRLEQGRFAPAVEFYAAPDTIEKGFTLQPGQLESFFRRLRYTERNFGKSLEPGEYSIWTGPECASVLPEIRETIQDATASSTQSPTALSTSDPSTTPDSNGINPDAPNPAGTLVALGKCIAWVNAKPLPAADGSVDRSVQIAAFRDNNQTIVATFAGAPPQPAEHITLDAELFAQYYGDRPILREEVPLAYAPADALNALLAIEDSQFFEHGGLSISGILRAGVSMLRHGRITQGGSTITQQLVKNYFLSDERTFKRKVTEMAMALLLEHRLAQSAEGQEFKDKILELYINTIYMGQNGVFEVRGFGAAARHYFGADLRDLNLAQSALLAAILNGPGVFDPFTKPENALKRRNRVLERMLELGFISADQAKSAMAEALPSKPQRGLTEPAPYFVQTVRRQLRDKGIDESEGLRIYTTLNLRAQEAAYQAVRAGLERLETTNPTIKKIKETGKSLEAVLLSSDPVTGHVMALVGGRGFKRSPYNRAFDSHRQIGSVMKPFVYLTALEKMNEDGQPFTPITLLKDEAFTHKWQGQAWAPRNYDGRFNGQVPMYWALKESLNSATAALGLQVGLSDIVDITRRLGVESKIEAFPALTLGAFELYPWEVLQAYGTLARLGELTPITFMTRVEDLAGEVLFAQEPKPEQVIAPETTAELVGMMKQTLISGTARGVRMAGFSHPAAGKTGTTNDKKDAWFAGFTPHHAAVVWVGYDDNTSHNLTGGSGSVPIWTQYMKSFATTYPADDFKWPESVEPAVLTPEQQAALGVPTKEGEVLEPLELIFKRGQVPEGASVPNIKAPGASAPDAPSTPNPFRPAGN